MDKQEDENIIESKEQPRFEQAQDGVSFKDAIRTKEESTIDKTKLERPRAKRNDDKAMLVLSGLSFVFFLVFFFLSFRYNTLKERVFVPLSLPFIISMASLATGIVLLLIGTIGLAKHQKAIRAYKDSFGQNK